MRGFVCARLKQRIISTQDHGRETMGQFKDLPGSKKGS